jgi:hypothetical protein
MVPYFDVSDHSSNGGSEAVSKKGGGEYHVFQSISYNHWR